MRAIQRGFCRLGFFYHNQDWIDFSCCVIEIFIYEWIKFDTQISLMSRGILNHLIPNGKLLLLIRELGFYFFFFNKLYMDKVYRDKRKFL